MNDDDYFVGDAGEDYKVSFNRIINYDSSEFRRLILVENAVINYSGGIYSLIERLEYEINHSAKALSIGEKKTNAIINRSEMLFSRRFLSSKEIVVFDINNKHICHYSFGLHKGTKLKECV